MGSSNSPHADCSGIASDDNSAMMEGSANYRSAFFEDDCELEYYHNKVKDALQVQLQKEINIKIDVVKQQYEEWS